MKLHSTCQIKRCAGLSCDVRVGRGEDGADNLRWTGLFLAPTLMKLTVPCYLFALQMERCKRGGEGWREGGGGESRETDGEQWER